MSTETEPTRQQRDMAVAVMRDVIEVINGPNSPRVKRGSYFWLRGSHIGVYADDFKGDLKDHAEKIQKHCQVCMLGLAVLSKARLYDAVPVDQALNLFQKEMHAALEGVFDRETLIGLECAFERNPAMEDEDDEGCATDYTRAAAAFGDRYTDDRDRAIAIAENVIANDGLFKP